MALWSDNISDEAGNGTSAFKAENKLWLVTMAH